MSIDIEKLTRPFPKHAIKRREGARGRAFDYVETHTVIHRLNEATGNQWDFRITRQDWRGDLLIVTGELSIPGLGTRTGTGVQKISDGGGEDLVKGAASDCLKKAATLFGVALELYGPDYEAGEACQEVQEARPARANGNGKSVANIGRGFATCETCGRPLTNGQRDLSTRKHGRPLCPAHQPQAAAA